MTKKEIAESLKVIKKKIYDTEYDGLTFDDLIKIAIKLEFLIDDIEKGGK